MRTFLLRPSKLFLVSLMLVAIAALAANAPPPMPKTPAREPAHPASIPLWPNGAPGSEGKSGEEIVIPVAPGHNYYSIRNIHHPSITPYLPDKEKATGAAVVVCPGGGHRELAVEHEGWIVGRWLADHGVAAFVLKYRLARETNSTYTIEGEELADVQRAIRTVRSRAQEWNINPAAIGVMGFSAGGQLAAMASMRYDNGKAEVTDPVDRQSCRPDFQALLYPGIPRDMTPTKETSPAFLVCGADDRPSISEALPNFYLSLKKVSVGAELHIYAATGHDLARRTLAYSIRCLAMAAAEKNRILNPSSWLRMRDRRLNYC